MTELILLTRAHMLGSYVDFDYFKISNGESRVGCVQVPALRSAWEDIKEGDILVASPCAQWRHTKQVNFYRITKVNRQSVYAHRVTHEGTPIIYTSTRKILRRMIGDDFYVIRA